MLNICFATEDFYPAFIGGQGIYGLNLVKQLAKKNKITVLAENKIGRKTFWHNQKNITLTLVPFCFGNQLILAFLEYYYFIFKYQNNNFDILHANQLSGLFFTIFKPKNIKKIVISVHNTNLDMFKVESSHIKRLLYLPLIFLETIMYRRADALIYNSPQAVYNYNKNYKAIYPGVTIPPLKKIKHNINVLYIGRIAKRKKVDTLISAMRLLPHFKSTIIGTGPELARLKNIAPSNVTFLGYVKNTQKHLQSSDIFVTASVAEGGFSLSVLEAASFGLPLIISPSVAGFPIVKNGINGYIVNPNNPQELANAIKKIMPRAKQMGLKSRQLAKSFSWQKCAANTINFYQEILKKH